MPSNWAAGPARSGPTPAIGSTRSIRSASDRLKAVKQELSAHGLCVEIPLSYLPHEAVAAYLAQRGVAPEEREGVALFVYRRTEGQPLFMVQVVDYLAQQGVLHSPAAAAALDQEVPQGLQQLIEAQLGRLGATAQQVLEVGSVARVEFVVASVAAGLQSLPETLERTRHELALQMALGPALLARHGATALVVEQAYVRMWELCQQVGETSQCCAALLGLGSCHIVRGRLHTARELLQQAVRCAPGAPTAADHGQAHVLGLQILAEARAVLAASEERYQEAELYRLQGALVWQCATCQPASTVVARPSPRHQPPLDTAAACFRQALAIARQQGARALELRAALSLSRLWQQQGKRTEAYELLAPIYDWFTEGFDTADLQEAQVLLEALKG